MEKRETEGTYWATKAHLNEQQSLLEGREAAQVHGRETTDGHSTDAVEEAVDIVDMELAIGGVEDPGENEGREGAVRGDNVSAGMYRERREGGRSLCVLQRLLVYHPFLSHYHLAYFS